MTALFATATTRSARRQATLSRGLDALQAFIRSWRNRRAFYRLGELTESELKDIGLTRADLFVASAASYRRDPTTRLRAIVEARAK